jgi:hypothetical protein
MAGNWFWSLTLSALAATTSALADEPKKAAGGPVEARLIADKDTYALDLNGLSAEDYRKQLKQSEKGGPNPPVPKVELTLELVNTSNKEVELRYGGTQNIYLLDLKGPGAETVAFGGRAQPGFILAPKTVTLAPGQSVKVKISSLAFGRRNLTHAAFWTAPGEYTLAVRYDAMIKPAPEGAADVGDGFGFVTLTSAPIKLKVAAK